MRYRVKTEAKGTVMLMTLERAKILVKYPQAIQSIDSTGVWTGTARDSLGNLETVTITPR